MKLNLKIGDEVLGGKFKNKLYTIKDFGEDENHQITILTTSGKTLKLLSVRQKKLMPKNKKKELKEFRQMIKDAE